MGNAGVIVEVQGSLPGGRVITRVGVAESMLSDCQEPSSSEGGLDPRVTDGNLLGVVHPGTRSEVLSMAHDRSSVVMLVAASQGYFMAGCVEEGGSEDMGDQGDGHLISWLHAGEVDP